VPDNKEVGAMLHGTDERHIFYYSGGVFNGEGPNFSNVDNRVDVLGRVFLAPFAAHSRGSSRHISIGGSIWYGQHLSGPAMLPQTTAGGLTFLTPRWTTGRDPAMTMELHQNGRLLAFAGELNVPLSHTFGLRVEGVYKDQLLSEEDITAADEGIRNPLGVARLKGVGGYAEVWLWAFGDDRMLPEPGLELPLRLRQMAAGSEQGLMIALRADFVKEDVLSSQPVLGDPNVATTRVVSIAAAMNYWYGRRVRVSANYVANMLGGTSENIKSLAASGALEHEILLRFATSL
jgi:hypothetical protein